MKVERNVLEREKRALRQQIMDMGRLACRAILDVADALDHLDRARAGEIIERDAHFNQLNEAIHDACVELIARQQPVATELREVMAELHIAVELERIADHVADIARIVRTLSDHPLPPAWSEILKMAALSEEMLRKMLRAYEERDAVAAEVIAATDDDLDRLNHQVVNEIIEFMRKNPDAIANGTKLIWLTHNFERVGDRVTNIGEQILYITSAKMRDLNRPRS
ncbi:MAG: phosphate signaling complex protein PhoU [Gammaproteobacteria bacterium]|nr:phosphate signaling complex protein PhoU [Gammaproteobacteria bacterium]